MRREQGCDETGLVMENDWTKVLGFPGYRVYQQEIDEEHQQLKLWIRRKRGNRSMTCAGCGRRVATKLGWSWRTTGRRCWDSRAIGSISRRSTKSTSSSSCGSGASGGIAA